MPSINDIREIAFGFASAEVEGANQPSLLLEGFYDAKQFTTQLRTGAKFLVLGYKGSGKSALGERLRLLAETEADLLVTSTPLHEFPFSHFTRVLKQSNPTDADTQFPIIWQWVLLLMALQSLSGDELMESSASVHRAHRQLQELGLLPAESVSQLVRKSTKSTIRLAIPAVGELAKETDGQQPDEAFLQYVENLRALVLSCRTPNSHVLVLDGLDELLTLKAVQYQILGALVLVVARLNALFKQQGLNVTFVLLCRTDLFAKLPVPNKNKFRQDSAIELDWYHDPRTPSDSALVTLANLRGMLSIPDVTDIFHTFFPSKMQGRDIRAFLCEHTRHTPRDFLQLLIHVQKFAYPGRIAQETLLKALRDYSTGYFLPEIRDELVGFISAQQADKLFAFLGSLRTRDFSLRQLEAFAAKNPVYKDIDLASSVELLFECSAIGNVDLKTGHFWFRYRNPHSTVNMGEALVFHPGLWKAFNAPDNGLPHQTR